MEMKSKAIFVDHARARDCRLQLTLDEHSYLEHRGLVVCEECVFEGLGVASVWRPRRPNDYFDRGDGVVLCPAHLRESGYMTQPTGIDLWLAGLAGLDDETIGESYERRPNTIAKSPDVRLGRSKRKWIRHERAIDLHEEGLSPTEIAEQMRMPLRSVQRALREGRRDLDSTKDETERSRAYMATLYGARDAAELQEWFDAWTGRELEWMSAKNRALEAKRDRLKAELRALQSEGERRNAELRALAHLNAELRAQRAQLEAQLRAQDPNHPLLSTNGHSSVAAKTL